MKLPNRPIFLLVLLWAFFVLSSCNRCREGCVNGQCIKRTCDCDLWYEGDRCDRSTLTKYAAYYRGTVVNDTGSVAVGFNLLVGSSPDEMISDTLSLRMMFVDDTRFSIPEQEIWGKMYAGEGEMLLDLVSIRIDPVDPTPFGSSLIEAERK